MVQALYPPEVVQPDQLQVVHHVRPAFGHQFALSAVDGFEEALEALHAVLRQQRGVQLQHVVLEEVLVDIRVQIRLVTHEFGVPLKAGLAVAQEDGVLCQTLPDLLGLRSTEPQLAVLQQKPEHAYETLVV